MTQPRYVPVNSEREPGTTQGGKCDPSRFFRECLSEPIPGARQSDLEEFCGKGGMNNDGR